MGRYTEAKCRLCRREGEICPFDTDELVVKDIGILKDGLLPCPFCGEYLQALQDFLEVTPFRAIASGEFIEDQIFNWTSRPQEEFHHLAAAGILVLLVVLVSMNAIAIFVRHKYGKKIRW